MISDQIMASFIVGRALSGAFRVFCLTGFTSAINISSIYLPASSEAMASLILVYNVLHIVITRTPNSFLQSCRYSLGNLSLSLHDLALISERRPSFPVLWLWHCPSLLSLSLSYLLIGFRLICLQLRLCSPTSTSAISIEGFQRPCCLNPYPTPYAISYPGSQEPPVRISAAYGCLRPHLHGQ